MDDYGLLLLSPRLIVRVELLYYRSLERLTLNIFMATSTVDIDVVVPGP